MTKYSRMDHVKFVEDNDKYIMASTNLRNTEIFALIAILVFKLLSRRVLIISRKTIETVKK